MLLACIEDKSASYRDRIKASEIIEARGYGRIAEEREQQPSQTLLIIRQSANGYERLNPGTPSSDTDLSEGEGPDIIDLTVGADFTDEEIQSAVKRLDSGDEQP